MRNYDYLSLINFKVKLHLQRLFLSMNTMLEVQIYIYIYIYREREREREIVIEREGVSGEGSEETDTKLETPALRPRSYAPPRQMQIRRFRGAHAVRIT